METKNSILFSFLYLVLIGSAVQGEDEMEMILESTDGRKIQAVIMEVSKESVLTRRSDGKSFEIPLSRLSPASILELRKRASARWLKIAETLVPELTNPDSPVGKMFAARAELRREKTNESEDCSEWPLLLALECLQQMRLDRDSNDSKMDIAVINQGQMHLSLTIQDTEYGNIQPGESKLCEIPKGRVSFVGGTYNAEGKMAPNSGAMIMIEPMAPHGIWIFKQSNQNGVQVWGRETVSP